MKTLMKYELVINEALRSALMYDMPDEQIYKFISFFGKHIGCDRFYIFEDNKKEHVTDNTYEWCAQGVSKEIDNLQGVDMDIINWWYDIFDEGKNVIIQDVETIKEEHPYTYSTLLKQNVKSLVVCPIRYKDEISAFFGVDNPPINENLGLTTFLDMIATMVVSFLKIRNAQIKTKRTAKLSGYSALAQIYMSMHYINVQTHQFHIVKINNVVLKYLGREALHEKYDIEDNFMKHMRTIYKKFCKPEYLEYEFNFIDLNTLEERLKNRKSIENVFYGKLSGWCRSRFIPVDYDEDGHLLHVLYCVECIDEQKKREDKLLYMAQTDIMTGISNRGSGEKMIERVLNNKVSGMMCLVDCDKFKAINDTYGHMVGDEVIIAIANTLQKSCRDKDVVMRLGGDEFAMFIPGVTEQKCAQSFIDRLFENINNIKIEALEDKKIVISLGACIYDGKEELSFDDLYYRADSAMYQSKKKDGCSATIFRK